MSAPERSTRPSTSALSLSATIELTPDQLDALAARVAELLRPAPASARFVDAATVAAALGLSRDSVYAKAAELGGVRVGDGPRPRWRFDLDRALDAWTGRLEGDRSLEPSGPATRALSRRRRRAGKGSSAQLLPIRGGADAS